MIMEAPEEIFTEGNTLPSVAHQNSINVVLPTMNIMVEIRHDSYYFLKKTGQENNSKGLPL